MRDVGVSELVSVSLSLSDTFAFPITTTTSTAALFPPTLSPLVCYGVCEHAATESNMRRKKKKNRTCVRKCEIALNRLPSVAVLFEKLRFHIGEVTHTHCLVDKYTSVIYSVDETSTLLISGALCILLLFCIPAFRLSQLPTNLPDPPPPPLCARVWFRD